MSEYSEENALSIHVDMDEARRQLTEKEYLEKLRRAFLNEIEGPPGHEVSEGLLQRQRYPGDHDPWTNGSIMIDPADSGATAVHGYMIERKTGDVPSDVAERQLGTYDKMVHRETDGPDPLVPEP